MAKQDYILKKYVRAESAAEALALDSGKQVDEVFLVENKPAPDAANTHAVGFTFYLDDGIPYEFQPTQKLK